MTPDDQIDAAELALGLLDGEARAVALERLLADPAFAAEVDWWRERFAYLASQYEAIEPPRDLLARMGRLPAAPRRQPFRRWVWLGGGAVGGALAASLAALLLIPASVGEGPAATAVPQPFPLVAVLVPAEGAAPLPIAALVSRQDGTVRLTASIAVPRGRVAELWRIGEDKVPRALGLLSRGSRSPVLLNGTALPGADEVLAISIEPEGGSPTGQPTGLVIASGPLTTV